MHTEEVNKIALSSNDDKRVQTFDKVTTYPYGTNPFMVCENEMLLKRIKKKKKNKLSIKMVKITNENFQSNKKLHEIMSESAMSRNQLQSLKNESQEVVSELAASRI